MTTDLAKLIAETCHERLFIPRWEPMYRYGGAGRWTKEKPVENKNVQAITENAEQLARELESARKECDQARADRDAALGERDTANMRLASTEKERDDALRRAAVHYEERRKLAKRYDELVLELHYILKPIYVNNHYETLGDVARRVVRERDEAKRKLHDAGTGGTSLAAVGKRANANCFKRGFHKPGAMRSYLKRTTHAIEELNEALLQIHHKDKSSFYTKGGKPEGVLAEFADAIIIISEMAHNYLADYDPTLREQGVSLDSAVAAKLEYNDCREDGVNGNSV